MSNPIEKRDELTYLSFGAGVQSTALLIMSNLGLHDCPRADVAIFADTGDEPSWVYETLDRMRKWSEIPVEVVEKGCLSADLIAKKQSGKGRFASIPAHTLGEDGRSGMLRRQCTREYKIEPIQKRVRELCGYRPRQRVKTIVRCMIGISLDEATRMKMSRTPWISNIFPLIDARMRRSGCERLVLDHGFPRPMRSSCVYCPYHSDSFWRFLKGHPKDWAKAVEFDKAARDMSMSGVERPLFVHRSLVPLDEVVFRGEGQPSLFDEECSGVCGV